ncbi:MAG: flavin monoamine oxidase family protein [Opitutaceae bacterium]
MDYIEEHGWQNPAFLYLDPCIARIKDEYQPFGNGLDELDHVLAGDFLAREGASDAAARTCYRAGGRRSSPDEPPTANDVSALFHIWGAAIFKLRGLPYGEIDLHHLKGGNELMTDAFAQRLGDRVRKSCPVTSINHSDSSVTVRFEEGGRRKQLTADHVVLCVSPMLIPAIQFTPALPAQKMFAINNTRMGMFSRVLLQSRTRFREGDIPSINLQTGDPHIPSVCETAGEVPGESSLLFGVGTGAYTPEETIAAFREFYPGEAKDTIEQCIVYQWWKEEPTCHGCERAPFPLGQLAKAWPQALEPVGRIHFAGAAFDNLWRGMDAATRSAIRAAKSIHEA